jgi:hypothetical protein
MRRVAAIALFAAACSNGAANPTGHAASAIQGGTIDADRATVAVVAHRGSIATLCSGSLIAPNVVVTARHCVAKTPPATVVCGRAPLGPSVSPAVVFVTTELTTDHSLPDDAGATYTVASIDVLPGGDDSCGFDLALLVLTSPVVNATPYTPSFATLNPGDRYSALGYGETCGDANNELCYLESGARRRVDGLIIVCATDCTGFEVAPTEWAGQKGLCSGDSGGPALDAQGLLVGFGLRGQLDPNGNCTAPVYAAIAPHKDFLVAAVRASSAAAGLAAPAWTAPQDDASSEDAAADASGLLDVSAEGDEITDAAKLGDSVTEPPPPDAQDRAAPPPRVEEPPADGAGCACTLAPDTPSPMSLTLVALVVAAARAPSRRRRARLARRRPRAPLP